MSIEENPAIMSISNPSDRKKMRGMLEEIVVILRRQDDLKLDKKVILDEIKKQFQISPKHAGGLAKLMFKDNYDEVRATQEDFDTLYETIVKSPNSGPTIRGARDDDSHDED